MTTIRQFLSVYRQYRNAGHGRRYCVRIAWGVAVNGCPF